MAGRFEVMTQAAPANLSEPKEHGKSDRPRNPGMASFYLLQSRFTGIFQ
jgi:hypothetical protein